MHRKQENLNKTLVMAFNLEMIVSVRARKQLSNCTVPRHTSRYQMEEIMEYSLFKYKLLLFINRDLGRKGICHTWFRGRYFSLSLFGDRYLKLGSKSDHGAEISWNIVQYDALAPRPEGLRS